MSDSQKERWGLYFHIPFCEKRCSYCDFCSSEGYTSDFMLKYLSALSCEFDLFNTEFDRSRCEISSVYFGGGTPSHVPPRALAKLLNKIRVEAPVMSNAEITVEVNPHSALRSALNIYIDAGFNRLSIGFQSLIQAELKTLGRLHDPENAVRTLINAREAGFANIGVDLIYGIPGQTETSWTASLEKVIDLGPGHISTYALTFEPGTPMHRAVNNGKITPPLDETVAHLYEIGHDILSGSGYDHYEVSNFALPDHHSKHNVHYWQRKPYAGFGLSAHSCNNTIRSWNTSDFDTYFDISASGTRPFAGSETLTPVQKKNEAIMLGLRTKSGLSFDEFKSEFGVKSAEILEQKYKDYRENPEISQYFENRKDGIRLNARGFFLSDEIITHLFF